MLAKANCALWASKVQAIYDKIIDSGVRRTSRPSDVLRLADKSACTSQPQHPQGSRGEQTPLDPHPYWITLGAFTGADFEPPTLWGSQER